MPEKLKVHLSQNQRQAFNPLALLPDLTPRYLIEAEGRQVKHQGLPRRSNEKLEELLQAIESAVQQRAS